MVIFLKFFLKIVLIEIIPVSNYIIMLLQSLVWEKESKNWKWTITFSIHNMSFIKPDCISSRFQSNRRHRIVQNNIMNMVIER